MGETAEVWILCLPDVSPGRMFVAESLYIREHLRVVYMATKKLNTVVHQATFRAVDKSPSRTTKKG
jgi:hypothetical protein